MRHARELVMAVAAVAAIGMAPPAEARHHRGAVAAGIAAGVIGGVALGALAARSAPAYSYGAPAYAAPAYGYAPGYVEEEAIVVERPAYGYSGYAGYPAPRRARATDRNSMYDTIDRGW